MKSFNWCAMLLVFIVFIDLQGAFSTQPATDILVAGDIVDKLTAKDKNLAIAVKARINEALDKKALDNENKIIYPLRKLADLVAQVAKEQPQDASAALLQLEGKLEEIQAGIQDYFNSAHAQDADEIARDKTTVGNEWWAALESARDNKNLRERLEQFYDSVLNTYGPTIIDQLLWPVKNHFKDFN
jgi:hypothetical protein